jgi:Ca2+-binding EF-hand superfamily protein
MRPEAPDRVRLIFTMFDVDNSGDLRSNDFELMANNAVGAVPDADDAAKNRVLVGFNKYWTTLAAVLDTNQNGRITFDEYAAAVLSPERFDVARTELAESLAALGDPDGDGFIDRPVFVALITAMGFELPEVHAIFDAFEPTDSDQIRAGVLVAGIKEYYRTGISAG